jgi:hypothetical protein
MSNTDQENRMAMTAANNWERLAYSRFDRLETFHNFAVEALILVATRSPSDDGALLMSILIELMKAKKLTFSELIAKYRQSGTPMSDVYNVLDALHSLSNNLKDIDPHVCFDMFVNHRDQYMLEYPDYMPPLLTDMSKGDRILKHQVFMAFFLVCGYIEVIRRMVGQKVIRSSVGTIFRGIPQGPLHLLDGNSRRLLIKRFLDWYDGIDEGSNLFFISEGFLKEMQYVCDTSRYSHNVLGARRLIVGTIRKICGTQIISKNDMASYLTNPDAVYRQPILHGGARTARRRRRKNTTRRYRRRFTRRRK